MTKKICGSRVATATASNTPKLKPLIHRQASKQRSLIRENKFGTSILILGMKAPISQFVTVLSGTIRQVVTVIDAIAKKKGAQ